MHRPSPWHPPDPLPGPRETLRLVLRWWRPDDAPAMLAAIEVDRAALSRYVEWPIGDNRDVAECVYHVERFRRTREERLETPTSFNMGIFDRASGDVLGGIGYNRIQPETAQAEVGYWVRPDRQRQGLCTEAVSEMVTWGFAPQSECGWGFRRITILCAQKNLASRRVPEKLGIPLELRARHERWLEGEGWADTLGFGLCADEWDPKAGRVISGIRP